MQQTSHSSASYAPRAGAKTALSFSTITQILAAALLGTVLLYGAGFASVSAAHNAAHDTRHAFAFPCH